MIFFFLNLILNIVQKIFDMSRNR